MYNSTTTYQLIFINKCPTYICMYACINIQQILLYVCYPFTAAAGNEKTTIIIGSVVGLAVLVVILILVALVVLGVGFVVYRSRTKAFLPASTAGMLFYNIHNANTMH